MRYSREFKVEVVLRIVAGGEGVAAVARSIDIDEKIVGRWRREYVRDPENAFPGPSFQRPPVGRQAGAGATGGGSAAG